MTLKQTGFQTLELMSNDDLDDYRRAVERHAIVAITDRSGRIIYVNDLFCSISGYSRNELLGSTHSMINSGYHPPEFWRGFWKTIASGSVWRGEICNRARDGSIYWVDSTIVPLTNADGVIRRYMAVRHPVTALKQAHAHSEELTRSVAFKESVLNSVSCAVIGTDPDAVITVFNRGAEELLGFQSHEVVGQLSINAICDEDELQRMSEALLHLRHDASNQTLEREWTYLRKDGTRVPVFVSLTAMRGAGGDCLGYLGMVYDISPRKRAENAVRASEHKFRTLYEAAPVALIRSSLSDGSILEANPAFSAMTGYGPEDLRALKLSDLTSGISPEQQSVAQADIRRRGVYGPMEGECVRKDGTRFQVLVNGMRDHVEGEQGSLWSIAQDITLRREMEQELRRAAHVDRLTNLFNRTLLVEQLQRCIRRETQFPGYRFAVLYVDLDRFKSINDSMGHTVGDCVLQDVARRLREAIRKEGLVAHEIPEMIARIGGDEFVILLDDIASVEEATVVAERLIGSLSEPFRLQGRVFNLSASIGIAISNRSQNGAEEYLRDADTAMYEAKSRSSGHYAIFDASMRDRLQRRLLVLNELGAAIHERQFQLAFQPIVHTSSGRMCGCEALLRWNHPRIGLVSPAEFIPIAEVSGHILEIGDWVLRAACAQFSAWRRRYGPLAPQYLCVNISRTQLAAGTLDRKVGELLRRYELPPESLHLEITETAVMHDPATALKMLCALKALGVCLDLDDFGVGYSSLGSINDFPIDVIKIDRSFVQGIENSTRVTAIVEAVAGLARNLNMELVAEGIETREQLERVRQLGCQLGQGYLFSLPIDGESFPQLFTASESGPSVP